MFKTTQTDPYETEFGGTTEKRIQPKMSVRTVVLLGLMIALTVVCERFFVWQTPITRISLAFLPKAIGGALLGPVYEALVCGISDVVGFFAFPQSGPFNPIITLASVIRGFVYGLLLFKKHNPVRILIAAAIDHYFAGLVVTTIGLCLMGGIPFSKDFLIARIISSSVGFAIEIIAFLLIGKQLFGKLKQINSQDRY